MAVALEMSSVKLESDPEQTPTSAVTVDSSLGVSKLLWLDCPDRDDDTRMKVNWFDESGASGYEAEEDGGDLPGWRGTDKSFERSWAPGVSYRWRIRSTGPNDTVSKWSVWAGVTCPSLPPSGLEVVCRDDGNLAVSWDAVTGASQYTATITSTPPPAPAAASLTSTKNLSRPSPNSNPPNSFEMDAQVGWTYAVQVKAEVSSTWSGFSDAESDTCEAKRPPAPTGVTASCQAGILTVTWNTAGAGLAKATSYNPRVFTGNPPTESTNWTANAVGHDTTSATIPATGEPDLPDSDVFQVKVKAANAAGDSPWSAAVDVTCGPPGPITGLQCVSAVSRVTKEAPNPERTTVGREYLNQLVFEWDKNPEAGNYAIRINRGGVPREKTGFTSIGLPAENPAGKITYTATAATAGFIAVDTEAQGGFQSGSVYGFAVRAEKEGVKGEFSHLQCQVPKNGWLQMDCSATGVLQVTWSSDKPRNVDSQTLTLTATPYGVSHLWYVAPPSATSPSLAATAAGWTATVEPGQTYDVVLRTDGTGGPVYTVSRPVKCPPPNAPSWANPNAAYDTPGWKWFPITAAFIAILGPGGFWASDQLHNLLVGNQNPTLNITGRSCRQPTASELAADSELDRVCEETWDETVNVRLDPIFDWRDIEIVQTFTDPAYTDILTDGLSFARTANAIRTAIREGTSLKTVARKHAASFVGQEVVMYVYNASSNQVWTRITPAGFCLKDLGHITQEDIGWSPAQATAESTEIHHGYRTKIKATINYCKKDG